MLTEYISKKLNQAKYKRMKDGVFFASIPGIQGVWGIGKTTKLAKKELQEVFEEWLFLQIRDHIKIKGLVSPTKINIRAYA